MSKVIRHEVNEEWAYSGIVEAGDFVFLSFSKGMLDNPLKRR
ncbi:MAG: hypothetical protein K0S01_412 [Herbinix sp.]|nr:hypothetical protein [Herbinix sp.]